MTDLPKKENYNDNLSYLKNIRHSLAHKTRENFKSFSIKREIKEIELKSRNNIAVKLTMIDFEIIINKIENQTLKEFDLFKRFKENLTEYNFKAIPKPITKTHYIKGLGSRRGEDAIIYTIASKYNSHNKYEKGITKTELNTAFKFLYKKKYFNRQIFIGLLPSCNKEGGCNFTTIGGLFVMLNVAKYEWGSYYFIGI